MESDTFIDALETTFPCGMTTEGLIFLSNTTFNTVCERHLKTLQTALFGPSTLVFKVLVGESSLWLSLGCEWQSTPRRWIDDMFLPINLGLQALNSLCLQRIPRTP